MSENPTYPLVMVEWVDSRGVDDRWHVAEDTHDTACNIRSVGYMIRDKPESITIAPHYGNDPEQYCGDMTIPRCAVQRIARLAPGIGEDLEDKTATEMMSAEAQRLASIGAE